MSTYNLSDNVNDSFEFDLRGKKYEMRYPTTGEIEDIQTLNVELEKATEAKDEARVKQANEKLEGALYGFIKPTGHETNIKEALKAENVMVLRNFNSMIRKELSL
jgi:hypothetical protein